jgi:hypothetical protein
VSASLSVARCLRKQLVPMGSQKPKHTARLEKMTRYRLRIQQFSLLIKSTLHLQIIPKNDDHPATATRN